jgi:hypothetical protein
MEVVPALQRLEGKISVATVIQKREPVLGSRTLAIVLVFQTIHHLVSTD